MVSAVLEANEISAAFPFHFGQEDSPDESGRPSPAGCGRWADGGHAAPRDILGAVAAGLRAALIRRVGNDVLGVGPPASDSRR
jgi:hypothetical protein